MWGAHPVVKVGGGQGGRISHLGPHGGTAVRHHTAGVTCDKSTTEEGGRSDKVLREQEGPRASCRAGATIPRTLVWSVRRAGTAVAPLLPAAVAHTLGRI